MDFYCREKREVKIRMGILELIIGAIFFTIAIIMPIAFIQLLKDSKNKKSEIENQEE